jgi:NADPH2:quinone reductase
MKAASVNFPDVLIIQDKYQVKPPLPFSPGAELAGIVKAVGEGVTTVVPGDAVIALTTFGAFAEEVKAQASRLLPIPSGMSYEEAAAFGLTYGTAAHALVDRASLAPGETVLVLGAAGGVGLAAIDVAKAMGGRVIACASTDEKLSASIDHGADAAINYAREDLRARIRELTEGHGIDVVVDNVGGSLTELALRSLAWRGRLLVVGFASGDVPKIALNLPLLKGASIVGVFWGEFTRREPQRFAERSQQLAQWYVEGRLKPHVSAVLSLDRAPEAIAALAARSVIGKIVVVPERR